MNEMQTLVIVMDIIEFYKTIGALDEISERQLINQNELNTVEHEKYLERLCKKYHIEYNECKNLEDNIIEMEGKIDEAFKETLIKKLMKP